MSKKIDAHILAKYKVGELVGSGAYGHVWKAEDKITHKHYALKKVFGAFRNNIDAQRTYREVEILQKIDHPNIIKLHKVLGAENKEDLYLIFELMEADLLAVVGYFPDNTETQS
jgi:mitogen-activated protein kinase 15